MPRPPLALVLAGALASACGDAGPQLPHSGTTTAPTGTSESSATPSSSDGAAESGGVDDSCEFANDGTCDEPGNCTLGTDESDCAAACESGEGLHLFAAACGFRDPPAPPPDDGLGSAGAGGLTGAFDRTVTVQDGESANAMVTRHYRLVVPASYDPERSIPLVIVMPGHRVSHFSLPTYTGLLRAADHNRFLVVFAEQQWRTNSEPRWSWWTDWNWQNGAGANPDIAYLVAVINAVAADYNVDLRRIYTAGHSRGAAMAFIAALELSDYIAGACVQSGFTEFGYLDARLSSWSGRKVPMYFVHGIQDPDVGVGAADAMVQRLVDLGWVMDQDVVYRRLDGVGHRWQPWLDQQWWDFLSARPLPE